MKNIKSIIIWTIVIFITLTLVTMKNEGAFDGVGAFGFPFTYYDYFEGKCDNCYRNFGLKPFYLIVDVLFALVLGFLIILFKRKFIDK